MSILKIKDQNNNWQSIPAMKGDPGVSPAVTVDTIQGGHQVTITDATHPQGQSFNVMDGQDAPAVEEIFWATYGTTTASEIQTALDSGKVVICERGGFKYRLDFNRTASPERFEFHAFSGSEGIRALFIAKSDSTWSSSSFTLENTYYKVRTTSTNPTIDNEHYYSALATKNLIDAVDAKIGTAVSLTFTYEDDTTQTYNLLTSPSNNS